MSKFLSPELSELEPYTPGEQPQGREYVKLNTNESPYPPSPEVAEAVSREEVMRLNLYPDPSCRRLKEKLACRYGVEPEQVIVSNGSDDILNFCFSAFCHEKKGMAFADITYGFYSVFAAFHRVPARIIPLREDYSLCARDYFDLDANIVIANPNAPTGTAIPVSDIEKIAASNENNAVIIDEAYVDFGAESALPLINKYENLLVVRTFSKSRSMAGARLGFAIGNPALIADLELIRNSTNPYDINRLTLLAGCAALDSDEYYMKNARYIAETRELAEKELCRLGFQVLPSKANFLFARHRTVSGETIYKRLKEAGVLVRRFDKDRIGDFLRITVGTEEQMDYMLKKLKVILASEENEK